MPPIQPIIRLDRVDVDIEGRHILRDIDLALMPGEHWGIVGTNGSGKSTLLALLAGLRWPAPGRGTRRYDFGSGPERDAVTARERVALIGHELQDSYVARGWNYRARDIVHSGITRTDIPQRRASPASKAEASALLDVMGLGHLAERRFLELSRGEQRRVLIARSLAFGPALLLLDEPASGLDAASREALESMLAIAARKTTIVASAHGASELPRIVTKTALLDAGRLIFDGPGRTQTASARDSAHPAADRPMPPDASRADPASGKGTIIALESASVWLGERKILHELDWQLSAGEHWLITGENGAGKSTLLRLLHGELRPALGGSISWPGLGNPRDVWTLRRRIALVSAELQARYRLPTRVFDAVASGLDASIGLTRALTPDEHDRVAALLEAFELQSLSRRWLSTLSYGQRHRALIARTLVTDPAVVLLDEPWEGLDADTCEIVGAALARRMAAGVQVICVSHVGARGLALNRTLTLEKGRIVDVGGSAVPRQSSASARCRASGSPPH
jgi:molybdate transport system ATP-binding protein